MKWIVFLTLIVLLPVAAIAQTKTKGVLLEGLTWTEAEKVLGKETIVVIPLGAAAKEHGPHLKLNNDWLIAEYLKKRVLEKADVVIAPTVNYFYYPLFLEYPGSTSLELETARNLVADVCKSFARYGVHKFYVINTGVITMRALRPAAELLAKEGLILKFTQIISILEPVIKKVIKQEDGGHADEIETSLMLYMAPATVDMKKAVKDYHPSKDRNFTRDPKKPGVYSPTGIYGDATLATRAKGEQLTKALVAGILKEIEELRQISVETNEK